MKAIFLAMIMAAVPTAIGHVPEKLQTKQRPCVDMVNEYIETATRKAMAIPSLIASNVTVISLECLPDGNAKIQIIISMVVGKKVKIPDSNPVKYRKALMCGKVGIAGLLVEEKDGAVKLTNTHQSVLQAEECTDRYLK